MVYHFLILSGEDDDFVREILIAADSSFLDFHHAIQESVDYDKSQLASFFVSDDEWDKGQEITLMMMDETADSELMADVTLHDVVKEVKDRLIYTFDFFGNRGFFVELLSISNERELKEPALVRSEQDAPQQIVIDDMGLGDDDDLFDLDGDDDLSSGIEEVSFEELDEEIW